MLSMAAHKVKVFVSNYGRFMNENIFSDWHNRKSASLRKYHRNSKGALFNFYFFSFFIFLLSALFPARVGCNISNNLTNLKMIRNN